MKEKEIKEDQEAMADSKARGVVQGSHRQTSHRRRGAPIVELHPKKDFGRRHSDGTSDTPADMAHRVSGVLYHHIHIQQIQHTTGHDRDRPTAGGTAERQIQSPVKQQPDNRKKPREQRAENAAEQQRQRPAHCHPATIHHKRTGE